MLWLFSVALLATSIVYSIAADTDNYDYDNKLEESGTSERDNLTSNIFILPKQIFNDGKPFYVKKDPVSGTINFNAKTTPESIPATASDVQINSQSSVSNSSGKHDISLSANTVRTQNIHDYLNLPVKYQSSKFVYPLVSSSYANLKYQGNNKNYISNHKYDSSTMKSVPYAMSNTKKYKTTHPTKAYAMPSSSTTAKKALPHHTYEITTKAMPVQQNNRKTYASFPPRTQSTFASTAHLYTTIGHANRVSSTTVRNSLPTSEQKISAPQLRPNFASATRDPFATEQNKPQYKPIASNVPSLSPQSINQSTENVHKANKTAMQADKELDSMNLGDLFSYFFNNDDNEEPESSATTQTAKTTISTTSKSTTNLITSTAKPSETSTNVKEKINSTLTAKYNITLDATTRRPLNKTTTLDPNVANVTTNLPFIRDNSQTNAIASRPSAANGKFNPPASVSNIRVSAGAQTASFVTNGQVSTGFENMQPYNGHTGQFQPPSSNSMSNIIVSPGSETASFVATGQLLTSNRFEQKPNFANDNNRRPISNPNYIDGTTKPGISFVTKGQVTSADAYVPTSMNNGHINKSASNLNNIVVSPGAQTASFITTSQLAMGGGNNPESIQRNVTGIKIEQEIQNIENDINMYTSGILSTQRPQGFILPSTTLSPKTVNEGNAQQKQDEAQLHQRIRFPADNSETESIITGTYNVRPATAMLTAPNNTIKFPPANSITPMESQPSLPNGLVKFTTNQQNEISDGFDRTNYKQQIVQNNQIGAGNHVVFGRPQAPPSQTQLSFSENTNPMPSLLMNVPELPRPQSTLIRNTPFLFKKPTFIHYPRKNLTLPNILPQFRPNTQMQQQLPMSPEMMNQIRQSQINRAQYLFNAQNLRYKMRNFGQRPLNPLAAANHMQIGIPAGPSPNRRHFELHPGNFNQRIYDRTLMPHLMHRNNLGPNTLVVEQQQRFDENAKVNVATNGDALVDDNKNLDYDENGDANKFVVQPAVESNKDKETPIVEPVTTLQMIQQQRLLQKSQTQTISSDSGLGGGSGFATNRNASDFDGKADKSQLYVVYPMRNSAAIDARPTSEVATILANQIPSIINKPDANHQNGLPYAFEKIKSRYILNSRPANDFQDKSDHVYDQPEIAAEYDAAPEDSEHPIAIAYSPTEPNPSHLADVYRPTPLNHKPASLNENNPNVEDNESQNQNFQAPFFPSINLENTQSTHNGWSVVTPSTQQSIDTDSQQSESKHNKISTSLVNQSVNATSKESKKKAEIIEAVDSAVSIENVSKKFDIQNFQPELQGGFKPIYKTNKEKPIAQDASLDRSDSLESLIYEDEEI